jgi:hypothetical protein
MQQMQHHIENSPIVIGNVTIEPQMKVQLLGVMLDSDMSMRSHVSRMVSSCFYQLRKSIRRSLPIEASKALVSALIFSRCDNQNGLFAGIAQKQIDRLQRILNASARLIFGALTLFTLRRCCVISCIGRSCLSRPQRPSSAHSSFHAATTKIDDLRESRRSKSTGCSPFSTHPLDLSSALSHCSRYAAAA